MAKMKAVVKTKRAPGAELCDIDIPRPGPNEILVKVLATSICGTDLHIFLWNEWADHRIHRIPQIMGHEVCGQVLDIGDQVKHIKKDDIISAETHIACGHCYLCQTGNGHICINGSIFGVDIDGVFAEYAVVPANNAWLIDANIPRDYGSIMEPLGNAVHTTLAGNIAAQTVLVTGCGPIGIMSIAVARACGATTIIATEINEFRKQLARQAGADLVLDPTADDVAKQIKLATDGLGVDVVIEMSGNPSAIRQGLDAIRPGGRFSILGIPDKPLEIDWGPNIIFKYITVQGINGRLMFSTWHQTARLLRSGRLDLEPIITHRFRLEEFEKGMDLMKSGNCGKILLYPHENVP
ncbi:MAG: L-threonine 3-dehydrogenase [candidate division WOR-3 bacterium]|nr:MAG: L-threonine 3-dehydrogenase [candidate division WOR-3 bacterium]